MTGRAAHRLGLAGLGAGAFATGLLLAGLLHLPPTTSAQQPASPARVAPALDGGGDVASLQRLSEAFASVAERVKPSVVYIRAEGRTETSRAPRTRVPPGFERLFPQLPDADGYERSSGSGFVVSRDGYVLTNAHVVDGAKQLTVRLLDRREFKAKLVGADPSTDVAVLKIEAPDLTPAPLGDSDQARVGEWVLAVGNPLGDNLTFTVTSGIISAKGRTLNLPGRTDRSIQDFIQTDAAINPGNSGGPLVSVEGEVVGINSAIASQTGFYSGYGFAVPVNLARQVMDQLIAAGRVHRAALGVLVRDATLNDAQYVGLPQTTGVLVQDFTEAGEPARRAGLEPGDIIVSVDGNPVEYTGQLQQRIAFRRPGAEVKIEVARKGGVRKTLTIPLQRVEAPREDGAGAPDEVASRGGDPEAAPVATLGVAVAPVDARTAEQLALPDGLRGVLVADVRAGGPAFEHLAEPGRGGPDIILAVEGTPVTSPAELKHALAGMKPGDIVSLRLYNVPSRTRRVERVKLE
ncbi:MAG TPA: trypsin-like peptidase domain-containing protein [Gemmatimonadales bacterium]|nr:trypsin-like peptidase domain-containing protein [Gemmatimonadales bacterium]